MLLHVLLRPLLQVRRVIDKRAKDKRGAFNNARLFKEAVGMEAPGGTKGLFNDARWVFIKGHLAIKKGAICSRLRCLGCRYSSSCPSASSSSATLSCQRECEYLWDAFGGYHQQDGRR